jgi:palmitoyltransferase
MWFSYCRTKNSFKPKKQINNFSPWINNCVGHRNHTTFVKFLFFAVVGCLHALLILGYILYHTLSVLFYRNSHPIKRLNPYIIRSLTSFIFILLSVSFSVGVIIAVGVLLYTQICAVLKNKTAIEDYICAKVVYRGGAEDFTYPYDLGFRRNFREVFPSLFASQPRGNGIWWPIHSNCTQFTLSVNYNRFKLTFLIDGAIDPKNE